MPRVETREAQGVLPTGAPMPYQSIHADPAAFGAGMGQAVQQLGQSFGQAGDMLTKQALIEQGLNNEAEAKDGDVAAAGRIAGRLFSTAPADPADPNGPSAGYFGLKGKAALDGQQAALDAIAKIREDALASASNPAVRRMLDPSLSRRMIHAQDQIREHANREQVTYWNDASQARIGAAKADGLNQYTDRAAIARAENTILGEVSDQGQHNGWSGDVTALKASAEVSDLYKGIVLRMAVQPDGPNSGPTAAHDFYAANIGRIQGAEHEQIERYLLPLVDRSVARQAADKAQTGTAATTAQLVSQEARAAGIDEKLALTTGGIESSLGKDPAAASLGQVKDGTAAAVGASPGGDLTNQAATMVKVLKHSQAVAADALGRRPDSWETYVTYQQGDAGGPALLNADPNANAVEVLTGVYKSPAKAARAIVGNGGRVDMTAGQFLDKWRTTYQAREAQVAAPGSPADPASAARTAEQSLAGQFQQIDAMALSPEQRDQAKSLLQTRYNQAEAAAKADQRAVWTQIMGIAVGQKATSLDQIPPDLLARADPETQRATTALIEHNARGTDAPPNPALYYDRIQEFLNDRDKFADRNLLPDAASLPRSDWEKLVGLQTAIGKRDAALADKETSLKKVDSVTRSLLGQAGFDLSPKAKEADKTMLVNFQTAMWNEVDAYQAETKRRPSDQDIQSMADRLLIQGRVRGDGWFGTDWKAGGAKQVSKSHPGHQFAFTVAGSDRANFYVPFDEIPKDRVPAITSALQGRGLPTDRRSIEDAYTQWRLQGNH